MTKHSGIGRHSARTILDLQFRKKAPHELAAVSSFDEETRWKGVDYDYDSSSPRPNSHIALRSPNMKTSTIAYGPRTHAHNVAIGSVLLVAFAIYAMVFRRNPAHHRATLSAVSALPGAVLESGSRASSTAHHPLRFTLLSAVSILSAQVGLIFDNGVNGLGTYIGKGPLLRVLAKLRFAVHASVMPLLLLPVTEIAAVCLPRSWFASGLATWLSRLALGWSVLELLYWLGFCDSRTDLRLVDMRHKSQHRGLHLPGTLKYTSDRVLELVLPAILVVLYELAVGISIIVYSSFFQPGHVLPWSGIFLCGSGALTLLSSAIGPKRPNIQLYGENLHNSLLWAALVSMPSP